MDAMRGADVFVGFPSPLSAPFFLPPAPDNGSIWRAFARKSAGFSHTKIDWVHLSDDSPGLAILKFDQDPHAHTQRVGRTATNWLMGMLKAVLSPETGTFRLSPTWLVRSFKVAEKRV